MTSPATSKAGASLAQIYHALPPDAQRMLLEDHLIPLLDDLPDSVTTKVINSARELQKRFMSIPKLDYCAKRTELEGLLNEIERDQKQSQYIKERSTREKLLEETIDSLSGWVNDVWSVIFEYQTNFRLAHQCLLLAAETLRRMSATYSGCNCAFINLRFVTSITHYKTGKVVKTFRITGVPNFERVILWTWRDLFVSMLSSSPGQRHAIPDMLQDIMAVFCWESLQMMVFGGRMNPTYGEDESDEDLESDMDDGDTEELLSEDEDHAWQDYPSLSPFHADHWPKSTNFPINDVRDLVQQCFVSFFQISPSLELYMGIRSISTDAQAVRRSLLEAAESNALWSSDNFTAALSIFAYEDSAEVIWKLHTRGAHLLRPRDAPEYQHAVVALANRSALKPRALKICQDQLLVIARECRASLCMPFARLYDPARMTELEALMKQKSLSRRSNIESWVTAITTPSSGNPNAVAFAAMMMGLPVPVAGGGMGGMPVEELNMLDLDKDGDPDLEDLREEFRPQFKARFEGWLGATLTIGKPDQVFRAVYEELVVLMPFIRDSCIVDEMLGRLSDKPSRLHIYDGLETIHSFVKTEVCKEQAQLEKRKRKEARGRGKAAAKHDQASSSTQGVQAPGSASKMSASRNSTRAGPSSMPMRQPLSGFDDVD